MQRSKLRDRKAECLRSFQIDHQLELGWLLHWQIAGSRAFELLPLFLMAAMRDVHYR
jgi:hypothetical protein